MDYAKLLYEYENKYREANEILYKRFIEEFSKHSSFKVEDVISPSPFIFYYDKFWTLHSYVLNKSPKDFPLFYSILEEMSANLHENLVSYIRAVSANVEGELPDYIRDIILRVPIIDEITSKEGKITIYSDKLGEYSFVPIKEHFKNDWLISVLLRHHPLSGECHNASWKLIKNLDGSTLVTQLNPGYFKGTYYHTVIKDKNDTIIDAASESVYDIDTYKRLMNGNIISETKQEDMDDKLNEAPEAISLSPSLVLALNNQQKSLKH